MPPLTVNYTYGDKVSPFMSAQVDILIPFHGQYTKVRKLVESILLHTTNCKYLITLIDDGSPNADFLSGIMKHAPVYGVRLEEQGGFGRAVNRGITATTHPWIVVLHSDVIIEQKTWLQNLGETMLELKKQNVRLVHARTNVPTVENTHLPPTQREEACDDTIVEGDEPLPLICALFHRELFNRIGGRLKEYPYAGYENEELFYRMKRHGFRQAVCGKTWVNHEGAGTISQLDRKIIRIMESNYDLCMRDLGVRP